MSAKIVDWHIPAFTPEQCGCVACKRKLEGSVTLEERGVLEAAEAWIETHRGLGSLNCYPVEALVRAVEKLHASRKPKSRYTVEETTNGGKHVLVYDNEDQVYLDRAHLEHLLNCDSAA